MNEDLRLSPLGRGGLQVWGEQVGESQAAMPSKGLFSTSGILNQVGPKFFSQ